MGGIFSTRDFVRDDDIPGQGKEVLQFCKSVHVTKQELSRIFHVFLAHQNPSTHTINIAGFFQRMKLPYSLLACVLFQLFDIHKTGEATFLHFLIALWQLLAADDDTLAVLCFSLFDLEMADYLELEEVQYLVQVVWAFQPSKPVDKAFRKLRQNKDGTVTLPEFMLLCKHHSALLAPVRTLRQQLRKKLIFPRFWKQIMQKRNRDFGTPSNSLRLMSRPKEQCLQFSMDYLNLRTDAVPREYIEQYKLVQRRKAASSKGQINWPHEVIDHYRLITRPQTESEDADEEDGFIARSTAAQAHTVPNAVDVPKALQGVLQGRSRPSSIYTPSQQQLADMHYIV